MKIKNISTKTIVFSDLYIPNTLRNVQLKAGEELVVYDEDAEKSTGLTTMIDAGSVSILSSEEPIELGEATSVSELTTSAPGDTIQIHPDASSAGRVRMFRDTTGNPLFNIWGYDSTDEVQKYITFGVFDNPAYTESGSTSRAIITSGGNTAGSLNALELQSPSQVRITAVDNVLNAGKVRIAADVEIQFHQGAGAETNDTRAIVLKDGSIFLTSPDGTKHGKLYWGDDNVLHSEAV